ncbi:MAG: 2-C-methyl-D-erythritol 4-phosphate cytidylyltransferase [Burkholderiales bacterium]|nr:2-C-methyl-D-erythritol 4-phosphate cytidylyltransferase [Phycisphaerae bacterium]
MVSFSVILPAAGASLRFGGGKLIADLLGQPVIVRTINAFLPRADVAEIIVATSQREQIEACIAALQHADVILNSPKLRWCAGGATRAHTVQNAAQVSRENWLAIHDAARPLVSQELIDAVFAAAIEQGAAAPALPVSVTIKEVAAPLPSRVIRTLPRRTLAAMQTPQCMKREILLAALANCPIPLDEVTDDVQLLELIGHPVMLVPGEEQNLKLTTRMDARIASEWLQSPSQTGESQT